MVKNLRDKGKKVLNILLIVEHIWLKMRMLWKVPFVGVLNFYFKIRSFNQIRLVVEDFLVDGKNEKLKLAQLDLSLSLLSVLRLQTHTQTLMVIQRVFSISIYILDNL